MNQVRHSSLVAAAVTGEGHTFDDFHSPLATLSYTDERILWGGCIDAPELVPVGGCKAVVVEGEYEGTTARTARR